MPHQTTGTDYFLLPLFIHESGELAPPSASYMDTVEVGYYTFGGTPTAYLQVTCMDQLGNYVYGGLTYNYPGSFPNGNNWSYPGGSIYIPAAGVCYGWIGAQGVRAGRKFVPGSSGSWK